MGRFFQWRVAVALGSLVFLGTPAYGRLGESLEDLKQRYGEPEETQKKFGAEELDYVYTTENWLIIVGFIDGRSHYEAMKKRDESEIYDTEIAWLLKANAAGSTWSERDGQLDRRWIRDDLGASARYYATTHILICVSKEFLAATSEKSRREHKKKDSF